jgi:deoxyribose-phosphate aldolase
VRKKEGDEIVNLAQMIDHTLLKPNATQVDVERILREAEKFHFASVCIHPYWVQFAAESLKNTDVNVCSVIGFPLGATTTSTKVFEAAEAMNNGANELDMVINIGELKAGHDNKVATDIRSVAHAVHRKGGKLKVIIETALLSNEEKVSACRLAKQSKADFVKTSTGFSTAGATVDDVALMRKAVGNDLGVKAAGGIHSYDQAVAMIHAGATRIGTSSGVAIVSGHKTNEEE